MFTTFDKAIAAGLISVIVTWLARYGVTLSPLIHDAAASIASAAVTYAVGHITVFLVKNKVVA